MALSDRVVVRLIVWEGVLRSGPMQQKQIKAHSEVLKRLINQCVGETPWRFQMWKVYNSESTETQKFEVGLADEVMFYATLRTLNFAGSYTASKRQYIRGTKRSYSSAL
jgi:hypothetical protein